MENRRDRIEAALRQACPEFRVEEFEDIPPADGKMGGCGVKFVRPHNMFGRWVRVSAICDDLIADPIKLADWLVQDLRGEFMKALDNRYRRN